MDGMSEQGSLAGNGVHPYRFRADFPPGTVVFMIGMRINTLWRIDQWLPIFTAMPKMLAELSRNRDLGLLDFGNWLRWREVVVIQYWKDLDHLMAYATARDSKHLPAWKAFNQRSRGNSHIGIWHEAYEVHPDTSHIVYRNMPLMGMGKATDARRIEHLPPQPVKRRGDMADEDEIAATA